jgi:FkbM family methyltransferase
MVEIDARMNFIILKLLDKIFHLFVITFLKPFGTSSQLRKFRRERLGHVYHIPGGAIAYVMRKFGVKYLKVKIPYGILIIRPCDPEDCKIAGITYRNYEQVVQEYIKKLVSNVDVSEKKIIVDVGSHIGLYTLAISKLTKDKIRVVSIEPSIENYTLLKLNIKINKLKKVLPLNCACSDIDGVEYLYLSNYSALHSTISPVKGSIVGKNKVIGKRLDTLLKQYFGEDVKIHLIKMDVEGAEIKCLRGLSSLLESHRVNYLIVEVHRPYVSERELIMFMSRYRYRFKMIDNYHILFESAHDNE